MDDTIKYMPERNIDNMIAAMRLFSRRAIEGNEYFLELHDCTDRDIVLVHFVNRTDRSAKAMRTAVHDVPFEVVAKWIESNIEVLLGKNYPIVRLDGKL